MAFSACPFCNFSVPTHELERHANQHFIGEDEARDMEFARRIAHLPPSPSPTDIAPSSSYGIEFTDARVATTASRGNKNDQGHSPLVLKLKQENNYISIYEDSAPSSSYVIDARVDTTASGGNRYDQVHASLVVAQRQEVFYKIECDLMVMLRKCLESESGSSRTVLCGYIDHFQSIVSHDHGWGCGWRNIQMLSSHLIKQRQEARQALYGGSGFVPNIESLQRWLELAWEKGFDPPGSDDFDRRVHGTRTWIGTTECAALLRSFGLRARIVDFSTRKAAVVYGPMDRFLSKGVGSKIAVSTGKESDRDYGKGKGHQVLARWVWNYFSSSNTGRSGNRHVVLSEKSPLYFQHDGHSRTIVGIQAKPEKNGMLQYNLLILDPSERTRALEKSLSGNAGWQQLIKRGVHTLKKPQYQLCYVDPGIASGVELEELKNMHSVLHEL